MPMDRARYPKNWEEIAMAIKVEAGWKCEECGRPCREPGESVADLIDRISALNEGWDLYEVKETPDMGVTYVPKPGRFVLTVAHLNHKPEDCSPANLKALCAPCHCRMDLKAIPLKQQLKKEYDGQLNLLECGGATESI